MISRRANVALVLVVLYVDMLGIGLAFPLLPKLVQQFEGGSFSRASWIFGLLAAAYALMQFLFAPALGALSDRFGRRPVILISLFGMGSAQPAAMALMCAPPPCTGMAAGF